MTRWAAGLEYVGSRYSGWQAQTHAPSVQAALAQALSRVANEAVEPVAAGRTDAGVHAVQQVIHFDTGAQRPVRGWLLGVNSHLPDDISLRWLQAVAPDFHARHSARSRRYRYLIHNLPARSALLHERAAWVPWSLDENAMHRAAQALVGERDFSAFRSAECQSNTPMRCVFDVAVRRKEKRVVIDIRANAFLHHMVRNIAGSLMEVGSGKQSERWIAELLAGRDRTRAGMNAPACGLYFMHAEYPAEFVFPDAPDLP